MNAKLIVKAALPAMAVLMFAIAPSASASAPQRDNIIACQVSPSQLTCEFVCVVGLYVGVVYSGGGQISGSCPGSSAGCTDLCVSISADPISELAIGTCTLKNPVSGSGYCFLAENTSPTCCLVANVLG